MLFYFADSSDAGCLPLFPGDIEDMVMPVIAKQGKYQLNLGKKTSKKCMVNFLRL